jgi:hypothetical protein
MSVYQYFREEINRKGLDQAREIINVILTIDKSCANVSTTRIL